jgi:hypothetical protein
VKLLILTTSMPQILPGFNRMKRQTRKQRLTRRRRLLTKRRRGGNIGSYLRALTRRDTDARSPVTSLEKNMRNHPNHYTQSNIPQPPPRSGSSSPNPLYSGVVCEDQVLSPVPVGTMQNSEENLYKKVLNAFFSTLTGKNNAKSIHAKKIVFLKDLRENRERMRKIIGYSILEETREKLIEKFCSANL